MIIFDDELIIENDASFYMDTIQAELSKETRVHLKIVSRLMLQPNNLNSVP